MQNVMLNKWISENKLIASFIGLSISSGIASGIMQLVIPLYVLSLQASNAEVGLVKGISQFGGLLLTLPGGFLIDRFGSRKIYIISGLINVLVIFIIPVNATLKIIMLLLFVEGAISSLRLIALNSAFFKSLNNFGYAKAGWVRASMAIGLNFIGPLWGGQLIQKTSYPLIFYIIGLIIFLPVSFLLFSRPTVLKVNSYVVSKQNKSILGQFGQLVKNKLLLRTAILQSLAISCATAFSVYIVVLIVDKMNYPPNIVSLIISTQGIGFIIIMFWSGNLLSKSKLNYLYIISFTLQIVGLLAIGFNSSLWVIWFGSIILGLGTGLITTVSYSILGEMKGEKGKISGFFYLISGTGMTIGPVFSGFLAFVWGIKAAFIGYIPLEIIVLLYFYINGLSKENVKDVIDNGKNIKYNLFNKNTSE